MNKEEFNAIFMDKNYLNYTLEEVQSAFWQMLKGYPDEHIRDYWKEFCVYLVEAIGNEQMSRM